MTAGGMVSRNVVDATRYRVNGVELDSWAVVTGRDEGRRVGPEWRDRSVEVPGAHGLLDYGSDPSGARRSYAPGVIVLSGVVLGVDPDTGTWDPALSYGLYLDRVRELMRMFYARTLVIEALRPDGVRRAEGYLLGGLAPAEEFADPWFGRWKVTVRIPRVFWESPDAVTAATPAAGVTSGTAFGLGALGACEAPIADGVLTFGPGSNPTLLQGGAFFAYDGVIPAGGSLVVDVGSWEVGYGAGTVWAPEDARVRFGPGPSWFEVDPTGASGLTLNHSGGGRMYAAVTARPKFLTS